MKKVNKRELFKKRAENYKKFHIPGCTNYYKRPKNAIYIRPHNSIEHEIEKLKICYELQKEGHVFITEAVENETGLTRDVVDIDTGDIYEVETNEKRAKRHDPKKIIVRMVARMDEKVCCVCGKKLEDEFVFIAGKYICVKCFKNSKG